MTANQIDQEIAIKRWASYPLLVTALERAICAFAEMTPTSKDYAAIDEAVNLLILLGERSIDPKHFLASKDTVETAIRRTPSR